MRDIRFVIVHRPGPSWVEGLSMFEQPGLGEHLAHFRRVHDEGKLMAGGPFLDGFAAGMMIPEPGLSEEEVRAIAEADPEIGRAHV